MIIAIDGPAGAGKSTVARIIAKNLGFLYVDTGAMYRALTLDILREKIDIKDAARIIEAARKIKIDLINNPDGSLKVLLDSQDVTDQIRQAQITKFVSDIAKIKGVRLAMLDLERSFAKRGDCVLDGRDIGTVVFPNADKKFYLDANFKERVKRRYEELRGLGQKVTLSGIESDLRNRDTIDSTREVAPLKKADDAIYIDTTDMSIEEVVDTLLKEIRKVV
jgi:cytidylate kinase